MIVKLGDEVYELLDWEPPTLSKPGAEPLKRRPGAAPSGASKGSAKPDTTAR